MIDVAIIGGGPAGLMSAGRIARAGLDVVLLEEHPRIGEPTHCTGIVSVEVADFAKISEHLVLKRLSRAMFCGPGGRQAPAEWLRADDEILVIDRAAFDQGLAAEASGAGARIHTNCRADAVSLCDGGVAIKAGTAEFRARMCILACGVSYAFQRTLGLGLPGQVIHTAQVEVPSYPSDLVTVHFGRSMAPEGFIWTVPVVRDGEPRLKVGVMARGDAGHYLHAFLARPDVRAQLTGEPGHPIRRLLPLRPLPATYADRVLAVGDAGGFTKPITGGGIFYSLLTASLAADTVLEAFAAGRFDEGMLSGYERRWQASLGTELRVADWLRQLVGRCSDAEIEMLVDVLAADDVQAAIQRTARFNWHRDVILSVVRRPRVAALLLRSLFR